MLRQQCIEREYQSPPLSGRWLSLSGHPSRAGRGRNSWPQKTKKKENPSAPFKHVPERMA